MKTTFPVAASVLSVLLCVSPASRAQTPVGTAFTYQGQLREAGSPAAGVYDFQFALYDGPDFFDTLVAGPITVDDEEVSGGLVNVQLDFGNVFDGTALWLWVLVRRWRRCLGPRPLIPVRTVH